MKNNIKSLVCGVLIILLVAVTAFAGVKLAGILKERKETENLYSSLTSVIDTYRKDTDVSGTDNKDEVLEGYRKLKEMNSDFVGWIRIEGTNIDYPVMQSPEPYPEFYLDHDFSREYNAYGVPFVDTGCTMGESNNIIIYGHRMTTDMMFHEILYYKDRDYQKEHPVICFDTTEETAEYEVMAVFCYDTDHDTFRFRKYTDMNREQYQEYLEKVDARKMYDTGIEAVYGDRLLTLSTCDYTYANGRFVVVAREVK